MLNPTKKFALVEIIDKYEGLDNLPTKYNEAVCGKCLSVGDEKYSYYVGKRLYWQEYKAGDVIKVDGKNYCAILLEDISVYETS